MNINLANIDFAPGQGGGGEAVIRSLDVTENGTYSAPSGVDGYNPVNVRVSGGSVTPEEQAALDTLVNSSEGILYTEEYRPYINYKKGTVFNGSNWVYRQVWLNDGLYTTSGQKMYKYNPDKYYFEEVGLFDNYFNDPVWQDMTGRTYCGVSYQLDFENKSFISVSLSAGSYSSSEQRHNIWKGQYGVYRLGPDPVKFDEQNQVFVSWNNVNMPSGMSLDFSSEMAMYGFWYGGHFVYINIDSNVMYELKEYSDHIDIEEVQDPYFPLTYTDENQNTYTLGIGNFISWDDSHLIWHIDNVNLKIVDGQWERIHIYSEEGQDEDSASYIPWTGYGDFIFGWNCWRQNFYIMNVSDDTIRATMWADVNGVAVDLKSDQEINGIKNFTGSVFTNELYISRIYKNGNSGTYFELGKNETSASSIKVSAESFMLNGNNVATTDQVIMNRQYSVYGPYLTPVVHQDGLNPHWTNYFSTHTGRVFYSNVNDSTYLEWDGSGWNTLAGQKETNVYNYNNGHIVNTPNATFYNNNGRTYLWDDSTSNFINLCENSGEGSWGCWWDGNNLRYNDSYKLVENGGVWSWVADTAIPDYKFGMYHYVNSKVYCLCFNDNSVYEYDPSLQTYTKLGIWRYWTQVSFVAGGDIIFPYNGSEYRKIDFSKVTPAGDQFIDTVTTIPLYNYEWMCCEHQGKLLMASNWYEWRYCYGINETTPEVPASNGTYTLKAVRSGDTVTYSWVLDV